MIEVLFPDGRYVVACLLVALFVVVFLAASDGADAALLGATVAAASGRETVWGVFANGKPALSSRATR